MLPSSRLRWRLCAVSFCTGFVLALPASSLPAQGGGTPKKSQYQNYWSQLKSRFQQWDLDGNKNLNKAELAKGFRGPDAKPYDDDGTDDAAKAKKGKVKPVALALACLPRPSLAVNLTLAELLSQPKPKAKTLDPAVTQYGDYQFLMLIGKDDQIAKQDYDNWCMGYARTLDQLQLVQRQVTVALQKLANAKSAKQKLNANNELAKHQADLAAANAQLSMIPPAIQTGLNVQR